jgi:hypothetical protein
MRSHSSLLVAASLSLSTLAGLAGCAVAAPDASTRGAQSISGTRIYLVPVDARARVACRAQDNRYYCSQDSADAARADCAAQVTGGAPADGDPCATGDDACVRTVASDVPCDADGETYPDAASCADPVPGNCSFYSACLEPEHACGESGYALGYGERYCDAFANDTGFSPAGSAWMESTMICLQRHLAAMSADAVASMSCTTLTDDAFASHPACYTQPGASICDLAPSDVFVVLHTISASDLFSTRALKQEASVARTCLLHLGGRLFGFSAHRATRVEGEPTEAELRERYETWSTLRTQLDAQIAARPSVDASN